MDIGIRQEAILELLQKRGIVEVEDLAGHFNVTTQTIRNDLRELDRRGVLRRTHGGGATGGIGDQPGVPGTTEAARCGKKSDRRACGCADS